MKRKKVNQRPKDRFEKNVEKDLMKIFGFFAILVLIFVVASYAFKSMNQFEYEGLTFTEERFGEIEVYHYYYYFEAKGELIRYNLYLRTDPRENNIPIEGDSKIEFPSGKITYITLDGSELKTCKDSSLAVGALSGFLSDNKVKIKGATSDFIESKLYNSSYVTCENTVNNPVISISKGDEAKIVLDGNCYRIYAGNECNVLEAVEKFELQAILDAKS